MTSSPAEVSVTRPWPAVKQPGVEVLFQLLDLEGHRRLGHEQGLGSLGEGLRAGQRREKPGDDDQPWFINPVYEYPGSDH
jgi:hypothetical protein